MEHGVLDDIGVFAIRTLVKMDPFKNQGIVHLYLFCHQNNAVTNNGKGREIIFNFTFAVVINREVIDPEQKIPVLHWHGRANAKAAVPDVAHFLACHTAREKEDDSCMQDNGTQRPCPACRVRSNGPQGMEIPANTHDDACNKVQDKKIETHGKNRRVKNPGVDDTNKGEYSDKGEKHD